MSALVPTKILAWLLEYMSKSNSILARGLVMRETSREVAREVVAEKSKEILNGQGDRLKDVMSLLIKANMSPQNENSRLSDEELLAQMLAVFIVGHETAANTISWTLLELSRRVEIQTKLREELHTKEREIAIEGRSEFTAGDLESLPYLNAVLKESLRYHTVAVRVPKTALTDDCLPLGEPIKTVRGVEINELHVAKGTRIFISTAAYNRNEALFGDDAHEFRPERWLEKTGTGLGKGGANVIYSNLLFEVQAFVVELIRNFEFSVATECGTIRREAALVMVPTIEGKLEKGVQCPLRVKFAKRDE
ncbi:hypothetical protein V5O48_014868 [Marasmius crinis-equi]|uniref:Cytochrome P450 n=1 Tax=Marasmius crinis-equi TaxID=585013 RepID=A0ABR3EWF1_9AGAR